MENNKMHVFRGLALNRVPRPRVSRFFVIKISFRVITNFHVFLNVNISLLLLSLKFRNGNALPGVAYKEEMATLAKTFPSKTKNIWWESPGLGS